MLDDFRRENGFTPLSPGAYLKLSALSLVSVLVVLLICGATRTVLPLGVLVLAVTEYSRQIDKVLIFNVTFGRADHPVLHALVLGCGYLIGIAISALGIYMLSGAEGAA